MGKLEGSEGKGEVVQLKCSLKNKEKISAKNNPGIEKPKKENVGTP